MHNSKFQSLKKNLQKFSITLKQFVLKTNVFCEPKEKYLYRNKIFKTHRAWYIENILCIWNVQISKLLYKIGSLQKGRKCMTLCLYIQEAY